jgi:hypothetical protein
LLLSGLAMSELIPISSHAKNSPNPVTLQKMGSTYTWKGKWHSSRHFRMSRKRLQNIYEHFWWWKQRFSKKDVTTITDVFPG